MRTFAFEKYMNPQENINIIYVESDRECRLHIHEFVELIFIVSGSGEHVIDGVSYAVEPGDLLFVNYGQTHSFQAKKEGFCYYNLLYVPEFFSGELINSENIYDIFEISLFREFQESGEVKETFAGQEHLPAGEVSGIRCDSPSQIVRLRGKDFLEMKKIVEDMRKEFVGKEVGYRSVLNGYSRVLFSKILRQLKNGNVSTEAQKCISRITADCLAYIDSRCFEKITLKEIAGHTFYNPAYFSRIFKEHCGISLSEYIKAKRIHEAARLLTGTDMSIEEIMDKVGYTDKKQFYKNFREVYNMTPAQFRKS